jgi:hypothetical protein
MDEPCSLTRCHFAVPTTLELKPTSKPLHWPVAHCGLMPQMKPNSRDAHLALLLQAMSTFQASSPQVGSISNEAENLIKRYNLTVG